MKNSQIELLRNVWLFERCTNTELGRVAAGATRIIVPAGKVLAGEGATGREFFVIVEGKAEVTRNGATVDVLGPGSFFGEMALLDRQPRAASVIACERCE